MNARKILFQITSSMLVCFLLLKGSTLDAQVTFKVDQIPVNTPADATLFISGSFEGWSGGASTYQLTKEGDGYYYITLDQRTGTIQYKFTRGSWASVEKGPNGEEIANRNYTFGGNGDTVSVQIASWAGGTSGSTASENVSILDETFSMAPYFNRTRTVRIYLPPNYDITEESYPVLYMLDGQNLFDQLTSFAGEWEVDETLDRLHETFGFDLIVVGIDNGGSNRIGEYTPWSHPTHGGGDGALFADFLTESLKPYVEANYRVKLGKENTGIMGSSLGGLLAHYAGLKNPDIYGKVGVFSPSFWFSDSSFVFSGQHSQIEDSYMFFMAGSNESGSMVPQMDQMISTMDSAGFPSEQMYRVVVPGGQHNEALWRGQFEEAVLWLFKDLLLSAPGALEDQPFNYHVFPNPTNGNINIEPKIASTDTIHFQIFQLDGKEVFKSRGSGRITASLDLIPPGLYLIQITQGVHTQLSRLIKY